MRSSSFSQQVCCFALEDDAPRREDVAAVGDRQRNVRVLLHDQHPDAGIVHLLDDLEAALDEDRGEAHRGLVHEQQLRLRHQRSAHRDHLLFAAGHRSCELVAALVEKREQLVDTFELRLQVGLGAQVGAHLEVLEHGHRPEQPPVLGHDRETALDPVSSRHLRHVLACETNRASARTDDPEDRLQRRRLARRVAAEQADELALVDDEILVLEDVDLPVVGVDAL